MGSGRLPPGVVADRARQAGEAARRAFSDAQGPGVPCATCPPPGTPDTELDGALIGRGCRPLTNPRAMGRLKPRQEVVGFADTGMGGQVPVFGDRPEDVGAKRQGLTRDEVTRAFQPANMVQPTSSCCERMNAGRKPRRIVYTNGILTDLRTHCETLRRIAEATCASVVGVYNATEGPVSDIAQVKTDRSLISEAAAGKQVAVGDRRNPAVDSLRDLIVTSVRDPEAVGGAPPEYWAHSQGGAITSLALYDAQRKLERVDDAGVDDLSVTTFNAAAPQWVDGPHYTHFVHQGDFVGMRTGIGAAHGDPAVAGSGATVVEYADLTPRDAIARALTPAASVEPTFAWREYQGGTLTDRGFAEPGTGPSAWNPIDASHHGIDGPGLGVYRQRQIATGQPICPEPARAAGPPPAGAGR